MKTNKQKKIKNKDFCEIFGIHAVKAALLNPLRKHKELFISRNKKHLLSQKVTKLPNEIKELDNKEMFKLFGNDSIHQGIVLRTSKLMQPSIEEIIDKSKEKKSDVILILDHVTDQNNIGSIIRSCALFDCQSLIVAKDNAPEINANIAKAASGALETVNYISVVNLARTIIQLKKNDYWVYGCDSNAKNYEQIFNLPKKCVLVFGSEGKGLRNLTKKECDELIAIPVKNQKKFNIDSLNVSNACSIALHNHYIKNK